MARIIAISFAFSGQKNNTEPITTKDEVSKKTEAMKYVRLYGAAWKSKLFV